MKKGFWKIALIAVISITLLLCVAIVSSAETDNSGFRVRIKPAYEVRYGYTILDALTEEGILRQYEEGEVRYRPSETEPEIEVKGSWVLAEDPEDESFLTNKIVADIPTAYAVFTPDAIETYPELCGVYAHVSVVSTLPNVNSSLNKAAQTIGNDVVLSFSVSHPKYSDFKDGLPTEFEIKITVVNVNGELIRELSTETVSGTEYVFTVPETISSDEYVSFSVSSVAVEKKYSKASAKPLTLDVLPKTDVSSKIDFTVDDIIYGEAPTFDAEFTGAPHGDGKFTYKVAKEGSSVYEDIESLKNPSGLLDAGKYNVIAAYEDKSQRGEVKTSFTVGKKTLSLTLDNLSQLSKVYDGTDSVLTHITPSFNGLLAEESVSLTYSYKYSDKNVGSVNIIIFSVAFDGSTADVDKNYVIASSFEFSGASITPKTVVVTPDPDQHKTYLDLDPEFTYTAEGLACDDTLSGSLTREEGEDFGSYAFIVSGLTNPNYTVVLSENAPKFEIRSKGLSGAVIELENNGSLVYNGSSQAISVKKITVGNYVITDYVLSGNIATNVGEYTLTVSSTTENFVGEISLTWYITPKDISHAEITLLDRLVYNGENQSMRVSVSVDGIAVDTFTVSDNEGVDASSYKLTVTGTDNFIGSCESMWSIAPFDISSATEANAFLEEKSLVYNGKINAPILKEVLGFDSPDVTVSGAQVNVGEYVATFVGKGNFTGSLKLSYSIIPLDISGAIVTLSNSLVYNGERQTQWIQSVKINGISATYTLSGNTATDAGTYTLTVKGTGNFAGSCEKTYDVLPLDISGAGIILGDDLEYNGKPQTQKILGVRKNNLNVTYTVSGNTATEIGTYTLTVTANGNFTGTLTKKWQIYSKTIASAVVEIDTSEFVYDGKEHTVNVISVKIDGESITYSVSGNTATDVGEYTITITGTGSYIGTKRLVYKITPLDISDAEVVLGDFPVSNGEEQSVQIDSVTLEGYGGNITYTLEGSKQTLVGVYKVTLLGSGNFSGSVECEWKLLPNLSLIEGLSVDNVTCDNLVSVTTLKDSISTDSALAEWSGTVALCESLIERIRTTEETISFIRDSLESLTVMNVKSSDSELLTEISVKTNALLYANNLTAAEREELERVILLLEELFGRVEEVKFEIERITKDSEKYSVSSVKSTDRAALEVINASVSALLLSDNLTNEERGILEGIKNEILSSLAVLTDVSEKIESVKSTLDQMDSDSVDFDDLDAVEEATETAEALLSGDNLTDSERETLSDYKEQLDGIYEKIMADAADIAEIADLLSKYTRESVKSSDREDIEAVKEKINGLLNSPETSEAKKNKLSAMMLEADSLIEVISTVRKTVDDAENSVSSMEDTALDESMEEAIDQIILTLETLLSGDNLTESEREEVNYILGRAERLMRALKGESAEIDELLAKVNAYSIKTVKRTDLADLTSLRAEAESLLVGVLPSQAELISSAIDTLDKLLSRIKDVSDMLSSEAITEYLGKLDNPGITVHDKVLLLNVKAEFSDIILGYEDNLTDTEKSFVITETERIDHLLKLIEGAEFVQGLIDALPDAKGIPPFDQIPRNLLDKALLEYYKLSNEHKSVVNTKKMNELVKAIYVYEIIRGDGTVKSIGDGQALEFETNAPEKLKPMEIRVDGAIINSDRYSYSNAILMLDAVYLDTLSVGEHTVTVVFQHGEASASFTIADAHVDTALIVAIVISSIGIIGVLVVFIINRKKLRRRR